VADHIAEYGAAFFEREPIESGERAADLNRELLWIERRISIKFNRDG